VADRSYGSESDWLVCVGLAVLLWLWSPDMVQEPKQPKKMWLWVEGGLFGLGAAVIVSTLLPAFPRLYCLLFGLVVMSIGLVRLSKRAALAFLIVTASVAILARNSLPQPELPVTKKDLYDALKSAFPNGNVSPQASGYHMEDDTKPITKEELTKAVQQFTKSQDSLSSVLNRRLAEMLDSNAEDIHQLADAWDSNNFAISAQESTIRNSSLYRNLTQQQKDVEITKLEAQRTALSANAVKNEENQKIISTAIALRAEIIINRLHSWQLAGLETPQSAMLFTTLKSGKYTLSDIRRLLDYMRNLRLRFGDSIRALPKPPS
jgi:hypothetical protein